jgi:hypothetical protein
MRSPRRVRRVVDIARTSAATEREHSDLATAAGGHVA